MADKKISVTLTAVDKLTGPLGAANRSIGDFAQRATNLTGVLGGLAGSLTVVSIAAFVKHAIDGADAMGKMAQQAGVGVEALSGLGYAAKLSGLTTEQLSTGLGKLNKSIGDAAGGSATAGKAFAAIGINVLDSAGKMKSADVVLGEMADKFAGMEDGAAKSSLAMRLLGKSGAEMIPFLNAGSDGIKSMTDEARRFGLVISTETAAAAEKFNDDLDRLKATGEGLGISLMTSMIDPLTGIADGMAKAAKEGGLLSAVLTGLGGIALWATTDELDGAAEKIREIKEEIAGIQRSMSSWTATFDNWWNGSNARSLARIKELRGEMAYLQQSQQTAALQAKAKAEVEDQAAKRATKAVEDRIKGEAAAAASAARARAASAAAAAEVRRLDAELARLLSGTDASKTAKLNAELAMLDQAFFKGKVGAAQYAQAVDQLLGKTEDAAIATKAWAAAQDKFDKASKDDAKTAQQDAKAIAEQVKSMRDATAEYGLSTEALNELEQARLDAAIAATEQLEIEKTLAGASVEEIAAIWDKIDALRELKAARAAYSGNKAAIDEATAATETWKAASNDIERSLTDALMRGFEGGKDWAENFKSTLKNMFSTLVLRPLIQPVAQAGASMAMGALGMGASGSAGAAGAAASGFSTGIGMTEIGAAAMNFVSAEGIGVVAGGLAEMAGASAATAGSVGAAAATWVPVVGWIIGALLLINELFATGGTPHLGNTYEFDQAGRIDQTTFSDWQEAGGDATGRPGWLYGPDGASPYDDALQQAGQGLAAQIAGDMERLGGTLADSFNFSLGFAAESEAETLSGGAATVTIGGETVLDIYKRYKRDGQKGMDEFLKEVMPKIELASLQVATGLHPVIDALVDSVDISTASLEVVNDVLQAVGEWGPLITGLKDYVDSNPLTDALEQIDTAGQTAWQTWQKGNTSLRDMASTYDGSLSMAQELAAATQTQYQMELSLIGQIQGLLLSTSAMFGNSIEQIQLSVMTPEQQYNYWRSKIDADMAALTIATDPADIARLSGSINTGTNSAFGLLDPGQQAALAPEFVAYLEAADATTTDRLNASQDAILAIHAATAADIETVMNIVADRMLEAANINLAAAQTPVTVSVDVTVDTPASAEVG